MKTLAVTGGIGSGKSEVVRMLAAKPGVRVLSADDEARRLMVEDEDLRRALISHFGSETYFPDGSLNRDGLAEQVFGNPAEVEALNGLVHPAVLASLKQSIAAAEKSGVRLFVYEAALLGEIGVRDAVGTVLLVEASRETRIERVMARNRLSREEVLDRMGHQPSPELYRRLADLVVENEGNLEALQRNVDLLYESLDL